MKTSKGAIKPAACLVVKKAGSPKKGQASAKR
jgi:hypothetical protein